MERDQKAALSVFDRYGPPTLATARKSAEGAQ
jgi:hypothetical protein